MQPRRFSRASIDSALGQIETAAMRAADWSQTLSHQPSLIRAGDETRKPKWSQGERPYRRHAAAIAEHRLTISCQT
jgi:hypothetical protein